MVKVISLIIISICAEFQTTFFRNSNNTFFVFLQGQFDEK